MIEKVKTVQEIIQEWKQVTWDFTNKHTSKEKYCKDWFYALSQRSKSWSWIMKEAVGMHKYLLNNK